MANRGLLRSALTRWAWEVVVRLFNMSLLPAMATDYRLTTPELADAIWNEACEHVERQVR